MISKLQSHATHPGCVIQARSSHETESKKQAQSLAKEHHETSYETPRWMEDSIDGCLWANVP